MVYGLGDGRTPCAHPEIYYSSFSLARELEPLRSNLSKGPSSLYSLELELRRQIWTIAAYLLRSRYMHVRWFARVPLL